MHQTLTRLLFTAACLFGAPFASAQSYSGVRPDLAHTNMEAEVGIGAVVPWAGSLWTNTYGPHLPHGSSDKLRQIDENWTLTVRPESVGGTPANRMIHPESQQLFIGHHVIDKDGVVRTIDPKVAMPGRLTANARHLTDPASKIYYFTMEDGLYEVDVKTLEVNAIIKDPINISKTHLPGYHGKGAYTGSGRLIVANNGEPDKTFPSGCLATWDGKDWTVVARNQFVEVTGPGGLEGNSQEDDRVWTTGWDEKSVRLLLLEDGVWHKFRMPKGSYTQDSAHGWNTEWPRIREIKERQFLGHMHGLFFDFPQTFSAANYGGIKPLGTYTKMPVDYAMFNGKLVIGKDDASKFSNSFVKQAQSNLWIGDYEELSHWGPRAGFGGPWLDDSFEANTTSEPFFVGGFDSGTLHLRHKGGYDVRLEIQTDKDGTGDWSTWMTATIPSASGYHPVSLSELLPTTQWIRIRNLDALYQASAYFQLTSPYPNTTTDAKFDALADVTNDAPAGATLQLPKGLDMKLDAFTSSDELIEVNGKLEVSTRETSANEQKIASAIAIKPNKNIGVDSASAYVDFTDANNKPTRIRLPKGDPAFDATIGNVRHIREIVTERTHMNLHGTFYELPRPKHGGFLNFWQMKPIGSHNKHIHDFCSWRGMLVFSGANPSDQTDQTDQTLKLSDTQALFLGEVDDLWKLGKPTGKGGPWLDTIVKKGQPSDPYLMLGYDKKTLTLSADKSGRFLLEIDYLGTGDFVQYRNFPVKSGTPLTFEFPADFAAHWLRLVPAQDAIATAQLTYE